MDLKRENIGQIIVDDEGYKQFIDEMEKLKMISLSIASNGSEAYLDAVGDGWHDNFAFEESMRESRVIACKINKMIEEKKNLKVIKKKTLGKDIVNINDTIKVLFTYSEDDSEIEIIKLTGKYIPNTDMEIKEITLNSPIGKVIYGKRIGTINEYKVNDRVISIKIMEKVN